LLPTDDVHKQLAHCPGRTRRSRVELLVGQRTAGVHELEVGPSVVPEDLGKRLVHAQTVDRLAEAFHARLGVSDSERSALICSMQLEWDRCGSAYLATCSTWNVR
jgi:hypothetical protein